eukprot:gene13986-biopygen13004
MAAALWSIEQGTRLPAPAARQDPAPVPTQESRAGLSQRLPTFPQRLSNVLSMSYHCLPKFFQCSSSVLQTAFPMFPKRIPNVFATSQVLAAGHPERTGPSGAAFRVESIRDRGRFQERGFTRAARGWLAKRRSAVYGAGGSPLRLRRTCLIRVAVPAHSPAVGWKLRHLPLAVGGGLHPRRPAVAVLLPLPPQRPRHGEAPRPVPQVPVRDVPVQEEVRGNRRRPQTPRESSSVSPYRIPQQWGPEPPRIAFREGIGKDVEYVRRWQLRGGQYCRPVFPDLSLCIPQRPEECGLGHLPEDVQGVQK